MVVRAGVVVLLALSAVWYAIGLRRSHNAASTFPPCLILGLGYSF